eukprot:3577733-Amphidinium_carterae.2
MPRCPGWSVVAIRAASLVTCFQAHQKPYAFKYSMIAKLSGPNNQPSATPLQKSHMQQMAKTSSLLHSSKIKDKAEIDPRQCNKCMSSEINCTSSIRRDATDVSRPQGHRHWQYRSSTQSVLFASQVRQVMQMHASQDIGICEVFGEDFTVPRVGKVAASTSLLLATRNNA